MGRRGRAPERSQGGSTVMLSDLPVVGQCGRPFPRVRGAACSLSGRSLSALAKQVESAHKAGATLTLKEARQEGFVCSSLLVSQCSFT
jgi:hypothetical protein